MFHTDVMILRLWSIIYIIKSHIQKHCSTYNFIQVCQCINKFTPCIMCVKYIGRIPWVHRDIMSTLGDVLYIGDIMMHVGDKSLSIYIENPDVYWTSPNVLMISPTYIMISAPQCSHEIPWCTHGIPPMYSWYPPNVLNIPNILGTHTGCLHLMNFVPYLINSW